MESDANWLLMEPYGAENGGCCISATLRDYGRIGLFVLKESKIENEKSVLPKNWITDISAPSNGSDRYASLWWIPEENVFCAIGIFGQMIWIDPAENLIVVTHSTWPEATAYFSDGYEFSSAVRDYLKD
jgi:CubicO group peptidase (beta-lactamase class C family)